MKNLIVMAFIVVFVSSMNAGSKNGDDRMPAKNKSNEPSMVSPLTIGLGLDIDFGRRKLNCDGRGLCRMRITVDIEHGPSAVYTKNDDNDGTIILTVPLEYIRSTQPQQLVNFKDQTEFVVEEDFTLPKDVSTKLGSENTLTVRAGTYNMKYQNSTWTILIKEVH